MSQTLEITVQNDSRVSISGDLDRHTLGKNYSQQYAASIANGGAFDLQGVSKVDSAGLAWLLNIVRDSQKAGSNVVFENVPERLLALAKLSDADGLLPIK
ncbi:STAS domain-containing protein [Aestuariibacter salexigens]|uniref:STAS domain-containing protein n=1 Tax=Aestuariibacter salexigens TaxID=226010 RepID=UPI00068711B6|nr:STAS domain-containing protein [Aestuariibacter salexigens]